jgi:two-component system NtrC family sensor kinase
VVVYNRAAEPVAVSASLTDTKPYPHLDPTPVLSIDPRPVLANGAVIDGYLDHPTHPVYYRIKPIFDGDKQIAGAFVLGRRGTGYDTLGPHDGIMLTIALLDGLVTVVILLIVRRNVSRPIKQLIERIRAIGDGCWEKRIPIKGNNEISSLASEFNQMCERLEDLYGKLTREQQERLALERSLRQSDKLASIGQLAAGLAHEIGTPLNIIGGRAEFLLGRSRSHAEISDNLQIIRSQIDRIAGIVRQLLEFSRHTEPAFRNVELANLVEKVIGLLEHKIREKNASVMIQVDSTLPSIAADPYQIQQVFLNLFLNSLHALPHGGTIAIRAAIASHENGNGQSGLGERKLCVEFEDNGAGISEEHLSQVFDPFFTTKDVGEGTGLGLSVSYGIIKDHGGEIRVDSKPGQFTRFAIFLPVQNRDSSLDGRVLQ